MQIEVKSISKINFKISVKEKNLPFWAVGSVFYEEEEDEEDEDEEEEEEKEEGEEEEMEEKEDEGSAKRGEEFLLGARQVF